MHPVRAVVAALFLAASPMTSAAPCAGFDDVSDSDPFCVYVEWIKNRGITLGTTAATYTPDGAVTRMQMAAFMYRLGAQNAFLRGGNSFGATATLGTTDDHALELQVNGERVARHEPHPTSPNLIGGSTHNLIAAGLRGATIGGGGSATLGEFQQTDDGRNRVWDHYGTIAGGLGNVAGTDDGDPANAYFAAVGGGLNNRATGSLSTVAGGSNNEATGGVATVVGGVVNKATGHGSTALGGQGNIASALASLAGGTNARADQPRCMVFNNWSSASDASCNGWPYSFHIYGDNGLSIDYNVRLAGGFGNRWVHVGKQVGGQTIATWTGAYLSDTGQWQGSSDEARKQDFAEVDKAALLDQVLSLPVTSWRYRSDPEGPRHIGPTAQDFNAAFGLGEGLATIGSIDANGVALAALQGLNAKLEAIRAAKDVEIAALRAELSELRALRAEVATIRAALPRSISVTASVPE